MNVTQHWLLSKPQSSNIGCRYFSFMSLWNILEMLYERICKQAKTESGFWGAGYCILNKINTVLAF